MYEEDEVERFANIKIQKETRLLSFTLIGSRRDIQKEEMRRYKSKRMLATGVWSFYELYFVLIETLESTRLSSK